MKCGLQNGIAVIAITFWICTIPFAKYDKKKSNSLSWENIKEMYAELLIPKEFEDLYLEIAGDDQVNIVDYDIILTKQTRHCNCTSSAIS